MFNSDTLSHVCVEVEKKLSHLSRPEQVFVLLLMGSTFLKMYGYTEEEAKETVNEFINVEYRLKSTEKQ